MLKGLLKYFLFLSVLTMVFSACKEDAILTDPAARLEFSQDTIMFDTVFVQTGSATQVFTVRNNNNQPVSISSLRLGGNNTSFYRLNVNGTPGCTFSNVEIGANDSIYIFVEVTIPDPSSPNTPFIVTDSILFELNGNVQYVNLVAFGQRAHFHHAAPNKPSLFYLPKNDTWTNDLPHVVYGYAMVDSGALTIDQGTQIYFHHGSGMIVLSGGKIIANGTEPAPVIFQGDRLGIDFSEIPGQWDRIWLTNIAFIDLNTHPITVVPGNSGPSGNVFKYSIIKNGFVGLQSDTVAVQHQPAATLNNTIIKNCASTGLLGQGTNIQANNCVIANCGEYCAQLVFGGDYRFLHCTFADYWSNGNRQTPLLLLQNHYDVIRPLDSAYFGNCILYGNLDLEIGLDSAYSNAPGIFNYYFDHCLLKVDNSFSTGSTAHFNTIIRNQDPQFNDVTNNNYQIGGSSPAVDAGTISITNLSPILNFDLKGNPRPVGINPDLGAYEIQ